MKKPRGRVPKHVNAWLCDDEKYYWHLLVCPKCGKWVSEIDHFAPYHTEMNKCRTCGFFKDLDVEE